MKRILLISLLMFSASLLDAMANPAVMLKASALLRRNLQIVDADVTIEHRDDGTFVHYLRNGQEMVVFDADLLKKSGYFNGMLKDIGSSDGALISHVKYLLEDLISIEQIKLAIRALDANNPSHEQGGIDNSAEQFVSQLDVKDLAWLANWADKWALESIYDALIARITPHRNFVFDLYNRGLIKKINYKVEGDISAKIKMSDVSEYMTKRLTREIVLPSGGSREIEDVRYSPDGTQILISTRDRVLIYDDKGNLKVTIAPQLQNRIWTAAYNRDGSNILVCTMSQILIYDVNGNLITTITPQLQQNDKVWSAVYNDDGSQILVQTNHQGLIYDVQGNQVSMINPPLQHGEMIGWVAYSEDGSHIFVTTARRVFIYGNNGTYITTIAPQLLQHEFFRSIKSSPDGLHIFMRTELRILIYDLQGNFITVITLPDDTIKSAIYNKDGSHILVQTSRRIWIYDNKGNLIMTITPRSSDYYDFDRIFSAQYSKDEAHILIATRDNIMMYDINGNLLQTIGPLWSSITSAFYSPDESHVLAKVAGVRTIVLLPVLNIASLDLAQKAFLLKASAAWKINKSYVLHKNELEIYSSLPEELKDKRLFEVPSGCDSKLSGKMEI